MNPTDKELLELAAKAGDVDAVWMPELEQFAANGTSNPVWNPLTDDGDALRLAAKLEIDIVYADDDVTAWFIVARPGWDNGCVTTAEEPYGHDKVMATRRVVVRAAAEIGKCMK
jgi:hypothetical protein